MIDKMPMNTPEPIENIVKLVKQEDRSGCALACIAMLARKPYAWIRQAWENSGRAKISNLVSAGNVAGLSHGETIDLMQFVGVDSNKYIQAPCIVSVKTEYGNHCIVISERGELLDPNEV